MATVTITDLTVDGAALPTPALQGVALSENKIWSANAGRDTSGEMVGTLVATKHKLEITWPPLTMEQYATIEDAVSTDWAAVSWTDGTGEKQTKTMYFGDLTGTQYSWADGMQLMINVSVSAIEK